MNRTITLVNEFFERWMIIAEERGYVAEETRILDVTNYDGFSVINVESNNGFESYAYDLILRDGVLYTQDLATLEQFFNEDIYMEMKSC